VTLRTEDRVELRIDSLASGGDGVGRLEGRVIFVPRSAPGDLLRVRVGQVKPRFARAEIIEVLQPGPGRREPPCPYYGSCGGCSWMHLREETQQQARLQIVEDCLTRIGGLKGLPGFESIPSPLHTHYRVRARVAYQDGRVGFRSRGSHRVVDVERCMVLDGPTQLALQRLREAPPSGQGETEIRGFDGYFHGYHVSPEAFFQANGSILDAWRARVSMACTSGTTLVELYAGVGFYTVAVQENFRRVIAVERASAARDLERNASVRVLQLSAEEFVEAELESQLPDVVLLNPPRTGCAPSVIRAIARCAPRRLVYVSCDPPTLARDIARLEDTYRVASVTLIDAMPQTHHIEVLVALDH
jgi:23S rRNA (uracil1939-C5)-methyltransferase